MKTNYNTSSLLEVFNTFSDKLKCYEYFTQMRWGREITCAHCEAPNPYIFKNSHIMKCSFKGCRKKFHALTGTAMGNTKIPVQKWIVAVYLLITNKRGL